MDLIYFKFENNKIQLIFVAEPELSQNEILEKLQKRDFQVSTSSVLDDLIIDDIIKQIENIPLTQIWILKEKNFKTILTIMKDSI